MSPPPPAAPAPAAGATAFSFGPWRGEAAGAWDADALRRAVERAVDPGAAARTLHWGRNYIYLVHLDGPDGRLPVAVKQFRDRGRLARLRRRLRGSKAARSWTAARALLAAGVATPEPVLLVESLLPGGPTFYASRFLDGLTEARYLLRAVNAGRAAEEFPGVDVAAFLAALGATARRLHDAGVWHRDLSSGNVLVRWDDGGRPAELHLLDLNRARRGRRLTTSERLRDLSRMMVHRPADQRLFLDAYWGDGGATAGRRALYGLYHRSFRARNDAKRSLRARGRRVVQVARDLVLPRGAHAHIPAAPAGAATRERSVWDPLSDQPHLHAGRLAKLASRLGDAGAHARLIAAAAGAAPGIRRRLRELEAGLYAEPVPFAGAGVAVRPWPDDPDGLLAALGELGAGHVLLRLHPWQDDHRAEEELAAALAAQGRELAFSLPQNRDLVRDPARWRAAVEELAERFTPFGRHFQVGQAINRSKWGVWSPEEYLGLAREAAEVLRARPGVEVLGPAVIDFEPLATAGYVNLAGGPHFDALASLLYVDRRGAPESRQAGFDTVRKVLLLAAVADTGRRVAGRSWITEFNWPLWEGPHSPAGRLVAVDEETQADYLVRYLVLALTTGRVERAYWWQLVARGYGLVAPEEGGALRRRPSFRAYATLLRQLEGAVSEGPLPAPPEARLFRFRRAAGGTVVVAWSTAGRLEVAPPPGTTEAVGRDGAAAALGGGRVELGPSPVYLSAP